MAKVISYIPPLKASVRVSFPMADLIRAIITSQQHAFISPWNFTMETNVSVPFRSWLPFVATNPTPTYPLSTYQFPLSLSISVSHTRRLYNLKYPSSPFTNSLFSSLTACSTTSGGRPTEILISLQYLWGTKTIQLIQMHAKSYQW